MPHTIYTHICTHAHTHTHTHTHTHMHACMHACMPWPVVGSLPNASAEMCLCGCVLVGRVVFCSSPRFLWLAGAIVPPPPPILFLFLSLSLNTLSLSPSLSLSLSLPLYHCDALMLQCCACVFGALVPQVNTDSDGRSKGFGFIRFIDPEVNKQMVSTRYHFVMGRRCEIKLPVRKVRVFMCVCVCVCVWTRDHLMAVLPRTKVCLVLTNLLRYGEPISGIIFKSTQSFGDFRGCRPLGGSITN